GGYGRGQLFPCSDVDILVLLAGEPSEAQKESLERLIGAFWDIGLEVGHSVRTVQACVETAGSDITIQTALLQARYPPGRRRLFLGLQAALEESLDPAAFFKAKKLEQDQRYAKHQDTAFALEPNLKDAPGGLRDLQIIRWISRVSGIGPRWSDLVKHKVI